MIDVDLDTRTFRPLLYQLSYLALRKPRIKQARAELVSQTI
jgi:hypothetical protein